MRISDIKKNRGFSLLELAIVLSIALTLSVLAFPYWGSILGSYRQSTVARIIVSDLRLARFEAVKNNSSVRLRLLTPSSYILEEDNGGGWGALRPMNDLSERYWTRGVTVSSATDPAVFYSSGRAESVVTFLVSSDGENDRQVTVSLTGLVRQ